MPAKSPKKNTTRSYPKTMRFMIETEEDSTLRMLLELDPAHAMRFIDVLKETFPDLEERYKKARNEQ